MAGSLTISESELLSLVAAAVERRVEAYCTPEKLRELAAERIGRLTLEEAAHHLHCANLRQLKDFLRQHRIPIRHYTREKAYVLLRDLEAADSRTALQVPDPAAPRGTRLQSIPHPAR